MSGCYDAQSCEGSRDREVLPRLLSCSREGESSAITSLRDDNGLLITDKIGKLCLVQDFYMALFASNGSNKDDSRWLLKHFMHQLDDSDREGCDSVDSLRYSVPSAAVTQKLCGLTAEFYMDCSAHGKE